MRKFISLLIIVVLLLDIGGYYLWFLIWKNSAQQEISQEIKKGLKGVELSLIEVSNNEQSNISWIKPNKEFRYKGDMYDIVNVKIQNKYTLYYCIKDIKEKQLIANFSKNHNSKKEAVKKMRMFKFQYVPRSFSLKICLFSSDFNSGTIESLYKFEITDINSPPPKSAGIF
jgi:hypothetical protein